MAEIDWMIQGVSLTACNCAVGCPCQFNSLPTHGNCRAAVANRIESGYFGDTPLDGVCFAGLLAWPGPIHLGGGEAQPIVDESASEAQRAAVLTIMKGEETDPGATIFNVFAATLDTLHEPLFLPIEFAADVERRVGRVRVPGVLEVASGPIRNPVTGAEHRARIEIPEGFEYTTAEVATATTKTGKRAAVALDWRDAHAHFIHLHWTRHGVVR